MSTKKTEKPRGPKSRTWRGWGVLSPTGQRFQVSNSFRYANSLARVLHPKAKLVRVVATLTPVAKKGAKRTW